MNKRNTRNNDTAGNSHNNAGEDRETQCDSIETRQNLATQEKPMKARTSGKERDGKAIATDNVTSTKEACNPSRKLMRQAERAVSGAFWRDIDRQARMIADVMAPREAAIAAESAAVETYAAAIASGKSKMDAHKAAYVTYCATYESTCTKRYRDIYEGEFEGFANSDKVRITAL